MEEKQMNLKQWLEAFKNNDFFSSDVQTQIKAGWYDWFCNDKSLAGKTNSLAGKVKFFESLGIVDSEKVYVFFKNNCPMVGNTYDDFRICSLKTGDVLFTITPSSGHTCIKGQSEVWSPINGFREELLKTTGWTDMKVLLKQSAPMLKEKIKNFV